MIGWFGWMGYEKNVESHQNVNVDNESIAV